MTNDQFNIPPGSNVTQGPSIYGNNTFKFSDRGLKTRRVTAIIHEPTGTIVTGTLDTYLFCKANGICRTAFNKMLNGNKERCSGWMFYRV